MAACRTTYTGEGPLHRAVSELSVVTSAAGAEVGRQGGGGGGGAEAGGGGLEVQQVECECCGMSEECTPGYIARVREVFCGRWVCGLCAEAVKEERHRMGRGTAMEEALRAHMGVCVHFNKQAREKPVLLLADAMRQMLLRRNLDSSSSGTNSKPNSPRGRKEFPSSPTKTLTRSSSSCLPAISRR